jgi:hypothetical protein
LDLCNQVQIQKLIQNWSDLNIRANIKILEKNIGIFMTLDLVIISCLSCQKHRQKQKELYLIKIKNICASDTTES